ncbi:hypothetical protein ACLK1S_03840 [Escherichia coli]
MAAIIVMAVLYLKNHCLTMILFPGIAFTRPETAFCAASALCARVQNHLTALLFTFFENLISPGGLFQNGISSGNNFFWFQ